MDNITVDDFWDGCVVWEYVMKYSDCGIVNIQAIKRPFILYREIDKGKNKGKIKVVLLGDQVIVSKNNIERYPKGE